MQNQNIKIKLKNLTKEPGIYKMLDKLGGVIYVGKAKNLKNPRTSQGFAGKSCIVYCHQIVIPAQKHAAECSITVMMP